MPKLSRQAVPERLLWGSLVSHVCCDVTTLGASFILELSVSLAHFSHLKDAGTPDFPPGLSLPVSLLVAASFQSCLFLFSVSPPYMGPSLGGRAQLSPVYPHDKELLCTLRGCWT